MKYFRNIIRFLDSVVNFIITIFFIVLLSYSGYALWDSVQIDRHADGTIYHTYKPSFEDQTSFEKLKKLNGEVFGWLIVDKTHIDYPLVQASNNVKYVNTDVKGEFSLSGSLFLDCQNKKNFLDINNIIYGHHMEKKAMFGELEYYDNPKYFEDHKNGKLYYNDKWHELEFFAFLHVDANDPILYNTTIIGEDKRLDYLSYIKENATYFKELSFKKEDRYLVLSTCTSSSTNGRHALVGRILK